MMKNRINKAIFLAGTPIAAGIAGILIARLVISPETGLTAAIEVLSFGLVGLLIGIVLGFLLRNRMAARTMAIINVFYAALIIWLGWTLFQFQKEPRHPKPAVELRPAAEKNNPGGIPDPDITAEVQKNSQMGIGIARAVTAAQSIIELYEEPGQSPLGKVSFKLTDSGLAIAEAPKNLNPAFNRMESSLLMFTAVSQAGGFIEVVLNETTGTTVWVSKEDVRFLPWSEFLFTVHSLEPLPDKQNLLRSAPEEGAPEVISFTSGMTLTPVRVQGNWLLVNIAGKQTGTQTTAWLKWKDENGWLIRYHLLR